MSIFTRIKDAIFGRKAAPTPPPSAAPRPATTVAPTAATPAAPTAVRDVDVEQILTQLERERGQDLNWRSSIVDLMKLLGMDSSLAERKELAEELGYTGARDGSAEMNLWLHRAVMRKLAENGGRVPASLTD